MYGEKAIEAYDSLFKNTGFPICLKNWILIPFLKLIGEKRMAKLT
jgi:hypothetical protein